MSQTNASMMSCGRSVLPFVAAMAVLVGCGDPNPLASPPAPSASAPTTAAGDTTDVPRVPVGPRFETFQEAMNQRGVEFGADDTQTAEYAYAVCAGLEAQVPLEEMVEGIRTRTGLSPSDTGFVIGAAASSFCPQHLARLTAR